MIRDLIVDLYGEQTYSGLALFFSFYTIWLPLILGLIFWEVWVRYLRTKYFLNTPTTLLEVRIPREISKSPAAMEAVFANLYLTGGEGTVIDRYWLGKTRTWFSFEIVSLGGELHFYIWTRENTRNLLESHLYAQYPEIEIREVEDYAKSIIFNPEKNGVWSARFKLDKPDPFPIKTYIDYGLHENPDEEFKTDPLVSLLEYMGSIKPNEQVWLQFIVRSHKKEKRNGILAPATDWKETAKAEVKKIHEQIKKEERNRPSIIESQIIEGIERSVAKYPFDVGIRVVYTADKATFSMGTVVGLRSLFRPFGSNSMNNLNGHIPTDFDYPWQDFRGYFLNRKRRQELDAYKRRGYFYSPHKYKPMVLTNEELATLYHFPGTAAATPGLNRIESKRAQAPNNLPI